MPLLLWLLRDLERATAGVVTVVVFAGGVSVGRGEVPPHPLMLPPPLLLTSPAGGKNGASAPRCCPAGARLPLLPPSPPLLAVFGGDTGLLEGHV